MSNSQTDRVTSSLLPPQERNGALWRAFGRFAFRLELLVYSWADGLCEGYSGGTWGFCKLSNGGFYMRYPGTECVRITVQGNGFDGEMSADAAGIVVTLFALCHLAEQVSDEHLVNLYHHLREFAMLHPEAAAIFGAID